MFFHLPSLQKIKEALKGQSDSILGIVKSGIGKNGSTISSTTDQVVGNFSTLQMVTVSRFELLVINGNSLNNITFQQGSFIYGSISEFKLEYGIAIGYV